MGSRSQPRARQGRNGTETRPEDNKMTLTTQAVTVTQGRMADYQRLVAEAPWARSPRLTTPTPGRLPTCHRRPRLRGRRLELPLHHRRREDRRDESLFDAVDLRVLYDH